MSAVPARRTRRPGSSGTSSPSTWPPGGRIRPTRGTCSPSSTAHARPAAARAGPAGPGHRDPGRPLRQGLHHRRLRGRPGGGAPPWAARGGPARRLPCLRGLARGGFPAGLAGDDLPAGSGLARLSGIACCSTPSAGSSWRSTRSGGAAGACSTRGCRAFADRAETLLGEIDASDPRALALEAELHEPAGVRGQRRRRRLRPRAGVRGRRRRGGGGRRPRRRAGRPVRPFLRGRLCHGRGRPDRRRPPARPLRAGARNLLPVRLHRGDRGGGGRRRPGHGGAPGPGGDRRADRGGGGRPALGPALAGPARLHPDGAAGVPGRGRLGLPARPAGQDHRAPTLLLTGSETPADLKAATDRAAAAIGGARVQVLEGHAHLAHRTDPAMVVAAIRRFVL